MLTYLLNDQNLVSYVFPYLWLINAVFVIFFEIILDIKAPYGRYNTNNSGVPCRLAWFVQELPCFVIPSYLLYYYWPSISITKFIIVGLFLIHYFQRYVEREKLKVHV